MNGIIIAIITGAFTFAGVIVSSFFNNKKSFNEVSIKVKEQAELTRYKIEQLEKKQEKHNSLIERMYKVEGRLDVIDEKIGELEHKGA